MKIGDRLQVVQDGVGIRLYFVEEGNKSNRIFTLGSALEALKYLLLDDEGRKRKDEI